MSRRIASPARLSALLLGATLWALASPPAAHAQPVPAPAASDGCPVAAGALPFTASAGGKLLSSGASLFTHDDSATTVVLHVPGSATAPPAELATPLDAADTVAVAPSGDGFDVTWTLADPRAPLRQLALKIAGAPATVRALNLRGLGACVSRQAGGDVADLKLPANLGTLHLRLSADAAQLIASTDDTDRLAMTGTLDLPALTSHVDVQGRFDAADGRRLTPLGALRVLADGFALQADALIQTIDAGAFKVALRSFALSASRTAPSASVTFTPVLPSTLPFAIAPLTAQIDGAGRLSLLCTPAAVSFTSSDIAVGGGPFKDLHVLVDTSSPSRITCDGPRFGGFEAALALRWDNVLTGGPLPFKFVASAGGVNVTLPPGATFPDFVAGSDARGLRLHVAAPRLVSGPAGSTGDALLIEGTVAVEFADAGVSTNPLKLAAALRGSGGALTAALTCPDQPAVQASRAASPGPFSLPLRLNCANGDVVGVASDGAELDLPAKAGGTHIKVPKFAFGFADRSLSVAAEITSKGSGSVLDFGSGHIDALNLSYDAENGLRMVATVSVSLPTGQDAKQTLTVHDVVLAKKETRLAFRGVGRIDVPDPFSFAGMQISKRTESDACKLADSPVVAKFNDAKEHLDLMLCATARFPSFLTPKQTQSHVGDLSKPGSAIIPPGDAGVFVNFNGLVIGPDGGLVDDGSPDVKTCPTKQTPRFASDSPEGRLLHDEERESLDCRVEAEIDETIALGALELQEIKVNLVRRLSDQTTVPGRPQFRIVALVKFGKYLSVDGGAFGVINAQFNDHRMVVAGHFSDVVSVRFGAVNAGIRGFSMDFSEQQRSFIAEGGQVSTGGGGVSTTTLYFSEIAFVETRTKNGDFKIAKLRAPVDVKRTGLGLLFRLVTDLGSTSFLHLFKLP